jgi:hypothetical protein
MAVSLASGIVSDEDVAWCWFSVCLLICFPSSQQIYPSLSHGPKELITLVDLGCLHHLLVALVVAVGNVGQSCLGLGMVVGDQEWLAARVFACQQNQESGDLQSPVSVDLRWTPVFLGL